MQVPRQPYNNSNSYAVPTSQAHRPPFDPDISGSSHRETGSVRSNESHRHHQRSQNVRERASPYLPQNMPRRMSSSSPLDIHSNKADEERMLRVKLLRAQILRVKQQMRQAEAVHDVTMRMLRTKASVYDKQMDRLECTRPSSTSNKRDEERDFLSVPNFDNEFDDMMSSP